MFNDRFIHNNTALASLDLSIATEATIKAVSPYLISMVDMVRGHSVLLKKKTVQEVYTAITQLADSRIALILAAARDQSGNQLFPDFQLIREFMFGIDSNIIVEADVRFNQKDIFIQGIERVSTALAAAYLIAQLSQLQEQAKHAQVIEENALADLDRILKVPALKDAANRAINDQELDERLSLYFKKYTGFLTEPLSVYCFMSSLNMLSWFKVAEYTDNISTTELISDLCDYVNMSSLNAVNSNIVASPVLSSTDHIQKIDFSTRLRDTEINSELISVKIQYGLNSSPFSWGIEKTQMSQDSINSLLLLVNKGKYTKIQTSDSSSQLNVLYIRKSSTFFNNDFDVVYRVVPSMEENGTATLKYTELDEYDTNDRPAAFALLLLNELYNTSSTTKVLGTIIKNDAPTQEGHVSAMQLVAYSASKLITAAILDILTVPPDLEIALGNIDRPVTQYSNKPRSLRVPAAYVPFATNTSSSSAQLVTVKESSLVRRMQDIKANQSLYKRRQNNFLI